MPIFRWAFDLAIVAIALYVAVTFYLQFRKEAGASNWQRLVGAAKDSQTILWNRLVVIAAGLIGNLDGLADYLNMPEAKTFIETYLGNPKALAAVMLAIASITIAARLRPGSKDPVS